MTRSVVCGCRVRGKGGDMEETERRRSLGRKGSWGEERKGRERKEVAGTGLKKVYLKKRSRSRS